MNHKRAYLTIPFAILASLAIPGIAAAHNATATPSCGGLSWNAYNYDKTVVNSIVVKVDGVTVHQDLDFKASDSGTSPWSQTANHAWSVVVNAPGSQYDKSFSGTWQACVATTTTVAPTTTTVPAPTTTVVTDPTTTLPEATTTAVVVEVGIPPVPPTTAAMDVVALTPDEPVLPRTGGVSGLLIAVGLVVLGSATAFVARRRVG